MPNPFLRRASAAFGALTVAASAASVISFVLTPTAQAQAASRRR